MWAAHCRLCESESVIGTCSICILLIMMNEARMKVWNLTMHLLKDRWHQLINAAAAVYLPGSVTTGKRCWARDEDATCVCLLLPYGKSHMNNLSPFACYRWELPRGTYIYFGKCRWHIAHGETAGHLSHRVGKMLLACIAVIRSASTA